MSLSPRRQRYKDALEALAETTEAELRDAIEALPQQIRDRLAEGPLPYRYDCGVCHAFTKPFYSRLADEQIDHSDPLWIVYGYHEIPKAKMKRRDDLHYGTLANETYERCLTTYRLAGWQGEAPEPNA